jgi:xanthine dehydrogenase accessory factor
MPCRATLGRRCDLEIAYVTNKIAARVLELRALRIPYVQATVVRAQSPTSAVAGDMALIHHDGRVEGFVGGQCAESSVRTAALGALRDGGTVLLRVLPEDDVVFPDTPGAQVVVNPCLSGGALEIFLEPVFPPPLIEVVGSTPVGEAIVAIADLLGYATARSLPNHAPEQATAVIVASHGRDEPESIRTALDAGVGDIALVASRKRGQALLDELELTAEERARISTPAGIEIGALTAPEVAVSILAEVIAAVRTRGLAAPAAGVIAQPALVQALDPICGMTVTVMPDTLSLDVDGESFYFCSAGCRELYAEKTGS